MKQRIIGAALLAVGGGLLGFGIGLALEDNLENGGK